MAGVYDCNCMEPGNSEKYLGLAVDVARHVGIMDLADFVAVRITTHFSACSGMGDDLYFLSKKECHTVRNGFR